MYNIKELIRKHFPYETPNKGQLEAIEFTINTFLSGKSHAILASPTGSGKSGIALTVHRVMREIQPGWRTTITAPRKNLQDQYTSEFRELVDLRGKTNYDCPQGVGPYNSAGCRGKKASGQCIAQAMCPYVKARTNWCEKAEIRITNTSFQIEACPSLVMLPENVANLIVLDECHNIDDQLVSHSTLKIVIDELTGIERALGKNVLGKVIAFINLLIDCNVGDVMTAQSSGLAQQAIEIHEMFEQHMEELQKKTKAAGKAPESIASAIEEMQQLSDKFNTFANTRGEWILNEYSFAKSLELKPVYASQVAHTGIFRKAEKFLHMSATICGADAYMKSIDLDPKDCAYMELDNSIPKDNRKIYPLNFMKVSQDYDRTRMGEMVDKIISRHPEQNGIIHTVSFNLAQEIVKNSKNKKYMLVSNDREEILTRLNSKKRGQIIVSPSIEEGYDFPGDLSRFQIIAKIPFSYIGDSWVKLNMQRHPEWYARRAIIRTIQACGRSVRGVNDFATTYIIDSNFEMLLRRNRSMFPAWFIDSLVTK